jgi:hypothetical protein
MSALGTSRGAAFEPEVILLMQAALEDAWARLPPAERSRTRKSDLAARILRAAANGERDPVRLRTYALLQVLSPRAEA